MSFAVTCAAFKLLTTFYENIVMTMFMLRFAITSFVLKLFPPPKNSSTVNFSFVFTELNHFLLTNYNYINFDITVKMSVLDNSHYKAKNSHNLK